MPISVIVEDGTSKANANTYQTSASITTRLTLVPWSSAWSDAAAITDRQDQINLEAAAMIDRLLFDGVRTTDTQSMQFPRAHLRSPDGYALASNLIPTWMLNAHARLAAWLAAQIAVGASTAVSPFSDTGLAPGTELELPGGLRLTPANKPITMPVEVRDLLGPYLIGASTLVRS